MRLYSLLSTIKIDTGPTGIGYNPTIKDADTAFTNILDLVYMWSAIVAVLIIIIAGYFLVTARGNPDQIKRGKDAIRGAVMGLMVILLAFIITQFILGRF